MAQCTAKSKRSGERCKNSAVRDGPGTCRMHGGRGSGRPVVHGLHASDKTKEVMFGERANELLATPGLTDIRGYIAVLVAMLEDFLSRLNVTGKVGDRDRDAIVRMIELIVKSCEKLRRLGLEEKTTGQGPVELIDLIIKIANITVHGKNRLHFVGLLKKLVAGEDIDLDNPQEVGAAIAQINAEDELRHLAIRGANNLKAVSHTPGSQN